MINVRFTPRVGVAPGTTTIALDGAMTGNLRCAPQQHLGGMVLGATDAGPCLPEAPDVHMTWPKESVPYPGGNGHPEASIPYGTESTMNGMMGLGRGKCPTGGSCASLMGPLGLHLIDDRQGNRSTFKARGINGVGLGAHAIDYRQGNVANRTFAGAGLGAHLIDRRQGNMAARTFPGTIGGTGLGNAPFGLSWKSFGTILAVAIGGGVGMAYLAERPTTSHAVAGHRRRR